VTTLPLTKKSRWFTTELAATLFAALPTFVTAVGGVVQGVHDRARGVVQLGVGVLIALVLGTTFKALQSHRKDAREAAKQSPRDLEGALYVLHAAILAMRGLPYDDTNVAKLRITIFRVIEAEDAAIQIVPYVGGGGGHEGTKVSRRSGVVGRAILRGKPAASIRDGAFDDYVQSLVNDYAVPAEEARLVPDDRFAFLAVPFRDRRTNRVIGVVYMDSPDRTFFSAPEAPRDGVADAFVRKIADACTGIVAYAELRYPSEGSAG